MHNYYHYDDVSSSDSARTANFFDCCFHLCFVAPEIREEPLPKACVLMRIYVRFRAKGLGVMGQVNVGIRRVINYSYFCSFDCNSWTEEIYGHGALTNGI